MSSLSDIEATTTSSNSHSSISLVRKRALGAFYTPLNVTKILCAWAIRSPDEIILEPSFGGCNFLESSILRMKELGKDSITNIFGCDIDKRAFSLLEKKAPQLTKDNFKLCNFLLYEKKHLPKGSADVIIGNPPYIRYSNLDASQKAAIETWEKRHSMRINRRASLWTYFSFHALTILKPGGRIAWILPSSFLNAQYAENLRKEFTLNFQKVAFFLLAERIFLSEGTEERAVIILAEGYKKEGVGKAKSYNVDTLLDLEREVGRWSNRLISQTHVDGRLIDYGYSQTSDASEFLQNTGFLRALGDIASVGIGVVPGDTKFFIRPYSAWREDGIRMTNLKYIVPKSRYITGLSVTPDDSTAHKNSDVPCFALDATLKTRSINVKSYLGTYSEEKIKKCATFTKRNCWYQFLDHNIPDALIVFMTHLGPKIVLNEANANATNGLYKVNFHPKYKSLKKLVAISMQTTFSQLEAERVGRVRGSGALKLEPSDAKKILIYLPKKITRDVDQAFSDIDSLMRQGKLNLARYIADTFIFSGIPDFERLLMGLEQRLSIARSHRIRRKK